MHEIGMEIFFVVGILFNTIIILWTATAYFIAEINDQIFDPEDLWYGYILDDFDGGGMNAIYMHLTYLFGSLFFAVLWPVALPLTLYFGAIKYFKYKKQKENERNTSN